MEQDFNLAVSKRPDPVEEILSSQSLKHHPFACLPGRVFARLISTVPVRYHKPLWCGSIVSLGHFRNLD